MVLFIPTGLEGVVFGADAQCFTTASERPKMENGAIYFGVEAMIHVLQTVQGFP